MKNYCSIKCCKAASRQQQKIIYSQWVASVTNNRIRVMNSIHDEMNGK
jgi:hypothetical protein